MREPTNARAPWRVTASAGLSGGMLGAVWAIAEAIYFARVAGSESPHAWRWTDLPYELSVSALLITFIYDSLYGAAIGALLGTVAGLLARLLGIRLSPAARCGGWVVLALGGAVLFGRFFGFFLGTQPDAWPAWVLAMLAGFLCLAGGLLFVAVYRIRRRFDSPSRWIGRGVRAVWACALTAALTYGWYTESPKADKWLAQRYPAPATHEGRPNVLLVVLDTLRADHVSCYGWTKGTTPNLDAFAADGVLFTDAMTPGSWTLPAHASIFTGLPVSEHQVSVDRPMLPPGPATMAETLRASGYQTLALSCNPIFRGMEFDRGFEKWETIDPGPTPPLRDTVLRKVRREMVRRLGFGPSLGILPTGERDKGAVAMLRSLTQWYRNDYDRSRPFFAYLNYFETHVPYRPALNWRTKVIPTDEMPISYELNQSIASVVIPYNAGVKEIEPQQLKVWRDLYETEVRYVDSQVGRLLRFLRNTGLMDETLVVVTSDHGEHLGEHHLLEHLEGMYQPITHVPLMIRYPPVFPAGGCVDRLVQTSDLFGTILRVCGADFALPDGVAWRDLTQWRDPDSWSDWAVCELLTEDPDLHLESVGPLTEEARTARVRTSRRAIRHGPWKYIEDRYGSRELYDLARDPVEQHNLSEARPDLAAMLESRLGPWTILPRDGGVQSETPQHVKDHLRQLGYLQ